MKNLFCILVVGAVLEMGTSQSKQCLTIDFESFENTNPLELLISDQFLNQFGVTFELENGSYPVGKNWFTSNCFQQHVWE